MAGEVKKASWGIRLAAVAVTLLSVVVVFAVKFSTHGNEMRAVFSAGLPIGAGVFAAFLVGLIKRLSGWRWIVYLYVLIAVAAFLTIVEFI